MAITFAFLAMAMAMAMANAIAIALSITHHRRALSKVHLERLAGNTFTNKQQ